MSRRDDLALEIRTLSDEAAVRALTALVEDRGLLAPAADTDVPDEALRDALAAAAAAGQLPAPAPAPDGSPAGEGDVARAALEHAAARPELAGVAGEAVEYAQSPADRFDPVSVSIGALVVALLQTEVVVKRDVRGRWSLTVHKRALRDAALGRLLTALLSHLTDGK
ncbi:hypothetical protein AB0D11_19890 [Streptomyces monashensis]|uniref:hypothetical protein n=1 Tax=Streptomyces monashensis TaxID=1678012 RepID=UPI0033D3FD6C